MYKKNYFDHVNIDDVLVFACQENDLDLVKELLTSKILKRNANIHYNHDEAFYEACKHGSLDMVQFLFESNDLKVKIEDGKRGLDVAISLMRYEICDYLLHHAKIQKRSDYFSILFYACTISVKKHFNKFVEYFNAYNGAIKRNNFLISFVHKIFKKKTNNYSDNFCHLIEDACLNNHIDAVNYLLDFNQKNSIVGHDKLLYTCLRFSSMCGSETVFDYILEQSFNQKIEFQTSALQKAFSEACYAGNLNICLKLARITYFKIDLNFDHDVIFKNACHSNNTDLLSYLIFQCNIVKSDNIEAFLNGTDLQSPEHSLDVKSYSISEEIKEHVLKMFLRKDLETKLQSNSFASKSFTRSSKI